MFLNRILLIFFSALIFCNSGYAQKVWSLDDCIDYAMTHNLTIATFTIDQKTAKEDYRQSIRALLPTINGFSDYNIRYGRSIDPNNNTFINTDFFSNNYFLDSNIDLFQGFQKLNAIKVAKYLNEAAIEDTYQQKYLLAFRVMQAYYDILFFQGMVEISKEQKAIAEANYQLVERQVELGMKALSDLTESESLLVQDKLTLTQSVNFLIDAKLKLIQEMNLDSNNIEVSPLLESELKTENQNRISVDSVYSNALGFLPLINSQKLRVEAAKKDLAVSRGNLYPSIQGFAGYTTGYYETFVTEAGDIIPFNEQITNNAAKYIGVSMVINISNGWSARSEVRKKKIALEKSKNDLELQKLEVFRIIQQLSQEQSALRSEYEQSLQKRKTQELAFKIAQKKHEKGLININELFVVKNRFATAQNENLQVVLKLKVNQSTIDFYNGIEVFNILK